MNKTVKESLPCGAWPSDISPDLLVGDSLRLGELALDEEYIYWLESRPLERGRSCIVRKFLTNPDAPAEDILKYPMSSRTKAHEYGGASYCVNKGIVYFVVAEDQCIYRIDTHQPDWKPEAICQTENSHFADLTFDEVHQRLICICEEISGNHKEPTSSIISIDLNNNNAQATLVSGQDFYSNPKLSPDGKTLSWLQWRHPNMPWDHTQCCIAKFNTAGLVENIEYVAGHQHSESIFQPQWSPDGHLYLVSDRNNWWNIYRYNVSDRCLENMCEIAAEFATPQWVFGMSTYGFLNSETIICAAIQNGTWSLLNIDLTSKTHTRLNLAYTDISYVACNNQGAAWLGASPTTAAEIVYAKQETLSSPPPQLKTQVIKSSATSTLNIDWYSTPQAITYPTTNGQQAHGFYYPPHNPNISNATDEKPPLIVLCHGGPTGATSSALNLKIQFWTSRGFAVLDVNYRGSTGYGRTFRQALQKQWGVADVDDVCAGAQYLVAQELADKNRLIIKGSSAGGYTVLAALTFRNTFSLGTSLYGIGDLETLARDTHKFESRYLDSLIGPYPEDKQIYQARSPIHHTEQLNCPVIFFQGLEDKVVPPAQAKRMVEALKAKKIAVTYVEFPNEGHGFRQANNITQMLEAEWTFYRQQLNLQ